LAKIMAWLEEAAQERPIVMPLHPRTRKLMADADLVPAGVRLVNPLGYLDMTRLVRNAAAVFTDSGGLQKEAYFHRVPCVTLRDETEWVETVQAGWNVLTGADTTAILKAVRTFTLPETRPELYGAVGVADQCVTLLETMSEAGGASMKRAGHLQ